MKFTLAWLKEYLEFESSPEELSNKLTSIGLEVESLKNPQKDLNNFIVSEIIQVNSHPNADKLKVCEVDNGDEVLEIVCGAPNARKGLRTVLASIGCIIKPGTKDEFKISKSKIRGIVSNGMLCSEEELNLSDKSEGLIELSNNFKIGESFSNCLSEEKVELEIAITPNRADCAGVYGIARDLHAAGFGTLKPKNIKKSEVDFKSSIKLINKLKEETCPQFLLRQIKDVKNSQSSSKIVERFNASNLKTISSLVDVTNYLTVDYCRPLHVFDYDKIKGGIEIRYSKKGEKFIGLDDQEYFLEDDMIVICDDEKIISLAGILGGKNTGCDDKTTNILIESAYFKPEKIAETARKLNIISDARYRFERGIDPNSTTDGIELATEMIIKNNGGKVGSIIDDSKIHNKNKKITVDLNFFSEVLGINIDINLIEETLLKIGCDLKLNEKIFIVTPPSWRTDIKIKEDLVEEVGRLIGYDKIPSQKFSLKKKVKTNTTSFLQKLKKHIKETLVSRNIMETISWSFSNKNWEQLLNSGGEIIEIVNPISAELSCLRTNLVGGLLNLINKNNNKNIQNISIFELGPVFTGSKPGEQQECLTVIRSGKAIEKNWTSKNRDFDIFDLKSDLFCVLKILQIPIENLEIKTEEKNYYHPGKSGTFFYKGKKIASIGELHPNIGNFFRIKNRTSLIELYLSELFTFCKEKPATKQRLIQSPFQLSIRDFSFEIDKNLTSIDLVNHIIKIDEDIIKSVNVFDNYEYEYTRAIAIQVVMQSKEKTLTDEEINELSEKIIHQAKTVFRAKLR